MSYFRYNDNPNRHVRFFKPKHDYYRVTFYDQMYSDGVGTKLHTLYMEFPISDNARHDELVKRTRIHDLLKMTSLTAFANLMPVVADTIPYGVGPQIVITEPHGCTDWEDTYKPWFSNDNLIGRWQRHSLYDSCDGVELWPVTKMVA